MITLHLDWLSVWGRWSVSAPDVMASSVSPVPAFSYVMRRELPSGGQFFERGAVFSSVCADGRFRDVATVLWRPRSSVLCETTCSIKFSNALLYCADYFDVVVGFLRDMAIVDTSVTRADFAFDFDVLGTSQLSNCTSDNMSPSRWSGDAAPCRGRRARSGVSPSLRSAAASGRTPSCAVGGRALAELFLSGRWVRRGSRRVSAFFQQSKSLELVPQSVTFGSHASTCQVQLYNKCAELRHECVEGVCPKQYIRDVWDAAGLPWRDVDVWRLEFRLTSRARVLCPAVGEVRRLSLYDISPERLHSTAAGVFCRYFDVYVARSGERHLERLERMTDVLMCGVYHGVSMVFVSPSPDVASPSRSLSTARRVLRDLSEHPQELADPSDAAIMSAAADAVGCVYNLTRANERRRQASLMVESVLDEFSILGRRSHDRDLVVEFVRSWGYLLRGFDTYFALPFEEDSPVDDLPW